MSVIRRFVRWNRAISEWMTRTMPRIFAGHDYTADLLTTIEHSIENGGAKLVHGSGWIVLLRAA